MVEKIRSPEVAMYLVLFSPILSLQGLEYSVDRNESQRKGCGREKLKRGIVQEKDG